VAYANDNGAALAPISADEFTTAGITLPSGVLLSANSALASVNVTGAQVDTVTKAQAVVDAYTKILAEANGLGSDPTPADPSAQNYAAIGVRLSPTAQHLSLLNDAVGQKVAADVDTVDEINALSAAVDRVMNTANGQGTQLTHNDFALLGVTGARPAKHAEILAAIAATVDDGSLVDTLPELQFIVDHVVKTPPNGTTSTLQVNGDHQLRMSDFGFTDAGSDAMTAVRILSGGHLFLAGTALAANTTVSVSSILAGALEWRAPNLNIGTTQEAISFQLIDNFGSGAISDNSNTLTLSRTIAAGTTLDTSGSRFDLVYAPGITWQGAFEAAIAGGGHLATFEAGAGNSTAVSLAAGISGFSGWVGLEQSFSGLEPGGGWHWISGPTNITWAPGEPNDGTNFSSFGALSNVYSGGAKLNDVPGDTLNYYVREFDNSVFVYRGLAGETDVLIGSNRADVFDGLGLDDTLIGLGGDDLFLVPNCSFARIDGGIGFDVVQWSGACNPSGYAASAQIQDIEAFYLGSGNQAVSLSVLDVQSLSSTTDTLYIASNNSADTLNLVEVIGTSANQWHNVGTANGLVTYQYFDAANTATLTRVLVEQDIVVS
jgi:hypothetical protein